MLLAVEPYVNRLEKLATDLSWFSEQPEAQDKAEAALNGELSKTLRQVVPQELLQEYGAYFTSDVMSESVHRQMQRFVQLQEPVMDLACGGGNLLLARARHLPIQDTLKDTLRSWGGLLFGADIHEEFIRATRARLILLAAQRGCFYKEKISNIENFFPHLAVQNSLEKVIPNTHMILNPPFTYIQSPKDCKWATGRVTQAALFITHCLNNLSVGKIIVSILPEILRSGSNYRAWRECVERSAEILEIQSLGRFDAQTDVDVFLLILKVTSKVNETVKKSSWMGLKNSFGNELESKLSDHCSVKVGRVVPYRDRDIGASIPYLDVRQTPAWQQIKVKDMDVRGFEGTLFKPPFVVVRRNSRSKDKKRAVSTLVTGRKFVAVENHLIVITPNNQTLAACRKIIQILENKKTDDWLNVVIRCRHLTVKSLLDIPWWDS